MLAPRLVMVDHLSEQCAGVHFSCICGACALDINLVSEVEPDHRLIFCDTLVNSAAEMFLRATVFS